jgi:hypothetical protein
MLPPVFGTILIVCVLPVNHFATSCHPGFQVHARNYTVHFFLNEQYLYYRGFIDSVFRIGRIFSPLSSFIIISQPFMNILYPKLLFPSSVLITYTDRVLLAFF